MIYRYLWLSPIINPKHVWFLDSWVLKGVNAMILPEMVWKRGSVRITTDILDSPQSSPKLCCASLRADPSDTRSQKLAMDQYLLIPFLVGYSHPFYPSYFDVNRRGTIGFDTLPIQNNPLLPIIRGFSDLMIIMILPDPWQPHQIIVIQPACGETTSGFDLRTGHSCLAA